MAVFGENDVQVRRGVDIVALHRAPSLSSASAARDARPLRFCSAGLSRLARDAGFVCSPLADMIRATGRSCFVTMIRAPSFASSKIRERSRLASLKEIVFCMSLEY